MLKIKKFVQGRDEEDWVRVWSAAYREYEDMRQMTGDEFRIFEKAPDFDPEGRFIAQQSSKCVGIIHAHVDKLRKERKGFIRSFGVVPEFRGKGIEEKLVKTALKELKNRGMEVVQAWAADSREDRISLWKDSGFELVRKFSLMERDLNTIPSGIGEDDGVVLKTLRKDSDEDLKVLNWLDNECFKEHFNYTPGTLERTLYFVREDPFFRIQDWSFSLLEGEHVGYVGVGIDEAYNIEKNTKCGWILDIGVLKPYRRRGIGTKLMLQGMKALKEKGMTTLMLEVDDLNVTKAMRLYKEVGFKIKKKDLTYEKNLEQLQEHNTA
ncbi:MAG: GNAT family N-acetyltransferase [Candidatus Bathyarchaeota archaeon]|nr:MAG: GNAT family N-acetyltransferase [Candidatus Bathyarchaeota archaeon]